MPAIVDNGTDFIDEPEHLCTIETDTLLETQSYTEETAAVTGKRKKYQDLVLYQDYVIQCLKEGFHQAEIIRKLWASGYSGSKSNAATYVKSVREEYGITAVRYFDLHRAKQKGGVTLNGNRITEKGLMERIWMRKGFTSEERKALNESHPVLLELERCVRKFREIFETKNMSTLYLFIIEYLTCPLQPIASFVNGLQRDIEAVENAVASEISNGFVEGTNNRVKMIRRISFGRCGQALLSAKLILSKLVHTQS